MPSKTSGARLVPERRLAATYVGGPTVVLDWAGLRLLTDPTFDPAGAEFRLPAYALRKTTGPALPAEAIGRVDAVLLSHDHHFDNLDAAGRALLAEVDRILTTPAGAERLGAAAVGGAVAGGAVIGVAPWHSVDLPAGDGRVLRVTGTPARHGPADGDRGPVTGFVLAVRDRPGPTVYVSGDTVWYEGVAAVAQRFAVDVAFLFMGAARVPAVGPAPLTMTADEGVEVARAFPRARIVPLHAEGWAHFAESPGDIDAAFAAAGLSRRLVWLEPGRPTVLSAP